MKTIITTILVALSFSAYSQQTAEPSTLIRYNRTTTAAQILHDHLKKEPAHAEYWYLLATTYADMDRVKEGLDSLNKAPSAIQNEPYYMVAKGLLFLNSGSKEEAERLFSTAVKQTKGKNAGILAAIAKSHITSKNGDYNHAITLLDKALKRDKKNADLLILKGNAYRMLHKGSEAYEAYRAALAKNPGSPEANYQLALIFLTQNNNDLIKEYLDKSLELDPDDPRPLYQLYRFYFSTDPEKSLLYYKRYVAKSDRNINNVYALTDLYYLTKKYDTAIINALSILKSREVPRLYLLVANSYLGLKDSLQGKIYLQKYISAENDSNLAVRDFETMADLYTHSGDFDSAMVFLERAVAKSESPEKSIPLYKKLAGVAKSASNAAEEAKWLALHFSSNPKATNLDLFNWGLAEYKAKEYKKADSVFQIYITRYPAQGFGYYWKARSNAAMDPEMKEGLAIPHYLALIEVIKADTTQTSTDKKWMAEAYGYLATYEANINNDYSKSVEYFKNMLIYDPENKDAEKYITILEKKIDDASGSK